MTREQELEARLAMVTVPMSRLLAMIYPEDVFTGESGDPGALAVVEARKALAAAQADVEAYEQRIRAEERERRRERRRQGTSPKGRNPENNPRKMRGER